MANLLIVTKNSVGMAHWLEALNAHYPLQVVNTLESVLTHKPNSGAIDLIILDADFIKDGYSQLPLMAGSANKVMIVGNNYPVAELIYQGEGNSSIALKLDISERTVKAHPNSTFRKLEVQDRLQLVVRLMNLDVSAA